jgi:hypothetical protein
MANKGPKTFPGKMNKAMTGDGRKPLSSALNDMFGGGKKKKR